MEWGEPARAHAFAPCLSLGFVAGVLTSSYTDKKKVDIAAVSGRQTAESRVWGASTRFVAPLFYMLLTNICRDKLFLINTVLKYIVRSFAVDAHFETMLHWHTVRTTTIILTLLCTNSSNDYVCVILFYYYDVILFINMRIRLHCLHLRNLLFVHYLGIFILF